MNRLSFLPLLLLSTLAHAEHLGSSENWPAAYRQECGDCHVAYPPELLPAEDWRKLQSQLSRHFGSDATVDRKIQAEIGAFLERQAGSVSRLGATGEPPRITQSRWFLREHGRLDKTIWRSPAVRSPANCEACHPQAAQGSYREREIRLPGSKQP